MGLMFIGASPGSTGGGIKTTTAAVLLALIAARVRSHRKVTAMGRRFSADTLGGAVTLTLLAAAAVVTGFMAVSLMEPGAAGAWPRSPRSCGKPLMWFRPLAPWAFPPV
jgi:trk system potassium uptake protein TrkH